jgi:hypothetical protein
VAAILVHSKPICRERIHKSVDPEPESASPKKWSALDSERVVRDFMEGQYPHPIFPETGGILPWAITDNGGRFFWLTKGSPANWPTIYYADRSPEFGLFEMPCTELLFKAVSGESMIFEGPFGSDFNYGQPDSFRPIPPKHPRLA